MGTKAPVTGSESPVVPMAPAWKVVDDVRDASIEGRVRYWFDQSKKLRIESKHRVPLFQINGVLVSSEHFPVNDMEEYKNMIRSTVAQRAGPSECIQSNKLTEKKYVIL